MHAPPMNRPEPPFSHAASGQAEALDPLTLASQLGSEVATALSSALERVNALAATGKIDRAGLRALREEIELARRIGITGQQVIRLASGRVPVVREKLDLTALLREALLQRGREIEARGIEVRQMLASASVHSDPTLLFAFLQTLLDWSFEHAVGRIDLKLDVRSWPTHARLACSFQHVPPDEITTVAAELHPDTETVPLDTMSWRLLQQSAKTLALLVDRNDTPGRTALTIEFPETVANSLQAMAMPEAEDLAHLGPNSMPLTGRHVLVMAARREVRNSIREALRPLGLMLDFVGSVDEAVAFCREGIPHAIVYDGMLGGDRFEKFRGNLMAEVQQLAFVQITETGKAFELHNVGDRQYASVGRDAIGESLPAAMMFELARTA
jgi:CheY-like chemotaxis protein